MVLHICSAVDNIPHCLSAMGGATNLAKCKGCFPLLVSGGTSCLAQITSSKFSGIHQTTLQASCCRKVTEKIICFSFIHNILKHFPTALSDGFERKDLSNEATKCSMNG